MQEYSLFVNSFSTEEMLMLIILEPQLQKPHSFDSYLHKTLFPKEEEESF